MKNIYKTLFFAVMTLLIALAVGEVHADIVRKGMRAARRHRAYVRMQYQISNYKQQVKRDKAVLNQDWGKIKLLGIKARRWINR